MHSPAKHLQREDLHHDVDLVHHARMFVGDLPRLPHHGRLVDVDENELDRGKLAGGFFIQLE